MNGIHFNIWSILILFGAAQGAFLAIYLFTRSENRRANSLLALLLTVVTLHLAEYAASITGITLRYPAFIATTYPLLFCIGPLFWLYCRSLLRGRPEKPIGTALHFLPPIIVLLLMRPFYSMPDEAKIRFLFAMTEDGILKIPAGQLIFMGVHMLQTVLYVLFAQKFIARRKDELKAISSDALLVKKFSWLDSFSRYFSIFLLLYFILVVLLSFINAYQVELDYVVVLIMSLSMYAIGYSAITDPEIFRALPDADPPPRALEEVATIKEPGNVPERYPGLKEKVLQYMDAGKPYLKSDLKLSELAEGLNVPAHQLSHVINELFLVNFYDFVNKYRVEEARKLLVDDHADQKILAIAFTVGFNSKATFNRVFKNFTGLTPSAYRDRSLVTPGATSPVVNTP